MKAAQRPWKATAQCCRASWPAACVELESGSGGLQTLSRMQVGLNMIVVFTGDIAVSPKFAKWGTEGICSAPIAAVLGNHCSLQCFAMVSCRPAALMFMWPRSMPLLGRRGAFCCVKETVLKKQCQRKALSTLPPSLQHAPFSLVCSVKRHNGFHWDMADALCQSSGLASVCFRCCRTVQVQTCRMGQVTTAWPQTSLRAQPMPA